MAMGWWQFNDPDFAEAAMGTSRTAQLVEILPRPGIVWPVLNTVEAVDVVTRYLALEGDVRFKIRVALKRLSQALRRHDVGDKAIELAIAFETLTSDSDSSEVTNKVKVRSTKLLGGDKEKRLVNYKLIGETYTARSKMVHTGHFDSTKQKVYGGESLSYSQALDRAAGLCADLIKIIIIRGAIPNWHEFDIEVTH